MKREDWVQMQAPLLDRRKMHGVSAIKLFYSRVFKNREEPICIRIDDREVYLTKVEAREMGASLLAAVEELKRRDDG